jgi:hypothetical protein
MFPGIFLVFLGVPFKLPSPPYPSISDIVVALRSRRAFLCCPLSVGLSFLISAIIFFIGRWEQGLPGATDWINLPMSRLSSKILG